jgi:hypothetical protein
MNEKNDGKMPALQNLFGFPLQSESSAVRFLGAWLGGHQSLIVKNAERKYPMGPAFASNAKLQ